MKGLKVGLVGCGHISTTHLKAWSRTAVCHCHGVFDPNAALAAQRARQFGIPRVFEGIEDLLEECDVVDVCSPPGTHAEIAIQVLEARRHLVIEKPLVIDVDDWDRLLALQTASPVTITVIHNQKFLRSIRQAKKWVDAGSIGDVIRISRKFLTSPTTDRMLGGDAHWSHALPGGRWFETLPHALYTIYQFAGPLEPASVTATSSLHAPRGVSADEVIVTLRGERCLATIHYSAHCEMNKRMFVIRGSEGVITIDRLGDVATLSRVRDRPWKRAAGVPYFEAGTVLLRMIPDRIAYLYHRLRGDTPHSGLLEALDSHLAGAGPPPTPLDEIDYVVRNSSWIGREIDRVAASQAEPAAGQT